jgi:hypothetical protein
MARMGSSQWPVRPMRRTLLAFGVAIALPLQVATTAGAAPVGVGEPGFVAVACPNGRGCLAVGVQAPGPRDQTLIEQWSGTHWAMVASPNPPAQTPTHLNAIACPTSASCVAVGEYADPHGGTGWQRTFAERWNGRRWSITPTPNPPGLPFARLNGIACPGRTICYAVGEHSSRSGSKSLIERWDGAGWSIVPTPNPPGRTAVTLNAVACPSVARCDAVGTYGTGTWGRTLVDQWSGRGWSIMPTPNPVGSHHFSALTSVACPTSGACYAVGFDMVRGTADAALVERGNGRTWTLMPTPSDRGVLLDVSCVRSTLCYTVGYHSLHYFQTLIERWNGTTWSVVTSPSRTGVTTWGVLVAVACPSSTNCHAVGIGGPGHPFAEHWNGHGWSIVAR